MANLNVEQEAGKLAVFLRYVENIRGNWLENAEEEARETQGKGQLTFTFAEVQTLFADFHAYVEQEVVGEFLETYGGRSPDTWERNLPEPK